MKRFGFTLAEVLITLAIIGVVSAITLPTLTSSTRNAQVGPKLAKAASMFEQATQAMLNENNVDSLLSLNYQGDNTRQVQQLIDDLSDFMKLTTFNTTAAKTAEPTINGSVGCGLLQNPDHQHMDMHFKTKDGIHYIVVRGDRQQAGQLRPHRLHYGTLYVDINGVKNSPNTIGRDIFAFAIYADGSLRPVGSDNWLEGDDRACQWRDECNNIIQSGYACAGHIFDHDLKILYR